MKKRLIGIMTAFMMSFSSFGVTQVFAGGPELSSERAEEECERMNWYFNNGQYLETIAVADDLLQNYTLDDWHADIVCEYRYMAQYYYEEYLKKSQRYTHSIPELGMSFTCRGDMSVSGRGRASIYFNSYTDTERFFDIALQTYKTETPEEYISKMMTIIMDFSSGEGIGYGEKFEILSSNYIDIGGFRAYQVVFRDSVYTNRHWTAADHTIGKMAAFKYGNSIYVIQAREGSYNWSDDFWDAMETVINSISFG